MPQIQQERSGIKLPVSPPTTQKAVVIERYFGYFRHIRKALISHHIYGKRVMDIKDLREKSRRKVGRKTKLEKQILKETQAERVIRKFGGARELMRVLNEVAPGRTWNPSSIYRWTYPREKGGTNGVIPPKALPYILKAARLHGIFLDSDDFYPGKR